MTFGTRQSIKKLRLDPLYLDGNKIQPVPTFKYLGFTLDSTLSFKPHINDLVQKVIHKRTMLSKLMPYLRNDVALSIYKMMILPYFDYCDVIYQSACCNDLDKLQRLQNKCLKTCLGLHRLCETAEVHTRAKCSLLAPRRRAHLCNFMYGRLLKEQNVDNRNIRTRRHDAPLFRVLFPHKESFKRSVQYSGAVTWNDLPINTRNIDSMSKFKALQKRQI